jgi:dihydrofolate reductase
LAIEDLRLPKTLLIKKTQHYSMKETAIKKSEILHLKSTISLIVAASENNAIGKDNKLLWNLPIDLKFFKNTTWGMPVVMGRKSFESMGKALNGRPNFVITKNKDWKAEGAYVSSTIEDALKDAESANCKEIFITGGGEIYKQSMELADKIYMTRIYTTIEGDTYFPEIEESKWELAHVTEIKADEKNKFDMSFQTWTRRQS